MLVQFSVKNFRSFKGRAEFSMVANSTDSELFAINVINEGEYSGLLKSAAILGKNAGGKSNFIKAFAFVHNFILNSSKNTQITENIPVESFRLNTQTLIKPSEFELHFIFDNILYIYTFSVDQKAVHHESLIYYPNGRPVELFSRNKQEIKTGKLIKKWDLLKDKTRNNALYLSVLAQFDNPEATNVFKWLQKVTVLNGLEYITIAYELLKNPTSKKKILEFLEIADLDILDINSEEVTIPLESLPPMLSEDFKNQLSKQTFWRVTTFHKKFDENNTPVGFESFDLANNESSGTQKMLALSAPVIDSLEHGKVLIIDEFESALHPLLSKFIIELFNSEKNKKNAQFIFTMHGTHVINNNYLRRDQIWIVDKDVYGNSKLQSIDDFKGVRKDMNYGKEYIEGRFGGIPFVEDSNSTLFKNDQENKRSQKF